MANEPTPSPTAQPYTWARDTPEGDALARLHAHAATDDDLIVIALAECQQAIEALPPSAVAPRANNMGGVFSADPSHASASALRARAMMLRLRERMGQGSTRDEENQRLADAYDLGFNTGIKHAAEFVEEANVSDESRANIAAHVRLLQRTRTHLQVRPTEQPSPSKEPGAKRCHVKCNNAAGCLDEMESDTSDGSLMEAAMHGDDDAERELLEPRTANALPPPGCVVQPYSDALCSKGTRGCHDRHSCDHESCVTFKGTTAVYLADGTRIRLLRVDDRGEVETTLAHEKQPGISASSGWTVEDVNKPEMWTVEGSARQSGLYDLARQEKDIDEAMRIAFLRGWSCASRHHEAKHHMADVSPEKTREARGHQQEEDAARIEAAREALGAGLDAAYFAKLVRMDGGEFAIECASWTEVREWRNQLREKLRPHPPAQEKK